jgi:hypothetical protein
MGTRAQSAASATAPVTAPAVKRVQWSPDHHLYTSGLKYKDGPNPNLTSYTGKGPRFASAFAPRNPENPPCTYEPPPFLRARVIRIREIRTEQPRPVTVGPGAYTPTYSDRPRVKVFRKGEGVRDLWPHLKREAELPEAGNYWQLKPFVEMPKK